MDSRGKLEFPSRVRELRVSRNLRQRDVASAIGVTPSTYGNIESNNHKTIRLDRVLRLAAFYSLDNEQAKLLVDAWQALPVSEYSKRQTDANTKRNAYRSKAKSHDRMKMALLEVTTLLVTAAADPDTLCACAETDSSDMFADREPCELCGALQLLGLSGWTSQDDVIAKLAKIQEGMTG